MATTSMFATGSPSLSRTLPTIAAVGVVWKNEYSDFPPRFERNQHSIPVVAFFCIDKTGMIMYATR